MMRSATTHRFRALALFAAVLVGVSAHAADTAKEAPPELVKFVQDTRQIGVNETAIRQNAIAAGWTPPWWTMPWAREWRARPSRRSPKRLRPCPARAVPRAKPEEIQPKSRGVPDDYVIGEGDVVQISVWREPEASVPSAVVRPDGRISMPLLKEIQIAGMTPVEAEKAVARQLSSFIVAGCRGGHPGDSQQESLRGGRSQTGRPAALHLPVDGAAEALSEAGGVTDYAKRRKIYVLRTEGGKQSRLPFDYGMTRC